MMLRRLLIVTAAFGLCALAACEGVRAPQAPGVCWQRSSGAGPARFTRLAEKVDSLENCAVLLEGLRLQGEGNTDGAFQGYYIYVNDDAISSSPSPERHGYPIFQPPQRDAIDADLQKLIKARNGKLPSAGDIAVERK
jgi:hypothetical protein